MTNKSVNEGRRRLLGGLITGLAVNALPSLAMASQNGILLERALSGRDRILTIQRSDTREGGQFRYWTTQGYDVDGYVGLCRLMRDRHANVGAYMDVGLLEILFYIQQWLSLNGIPNVIHLNSGFRTEQTNSHIEGAARNSMHLYAMASDITIPGINPTVLGHMAMELSAGGVGFYPGTDFIHVDRGRVRTWVKPRLLHR